MTKPDCSMLRFFISWFRFTIFDHIDCGVGEWIGDKNKSMQFRMVINVHIVYFYGIMQDILYRNNLYFYCIPSVKLACASVIALRG